MAVSTKTPRELIQTALRSINYIGAGQTPSSDDYDESYDIYVEMMEAWNTETFAPIGIYRGEWDLTVGKSEYTIGPGGDFDTNRPDRLRGAAWQDGDLEVPVYVEPTYREWGGIPVKGTTSTRISTVFLERSYNNLGQGRLLVYPVPSVTTKLILYLERQLDAVAIDDPIILPTGYIRAIRLNLAVELGPQFDMPVRQDLERLAMKALGRLKERNIRPEPIDPDPGALAGSGYGSFNRESIEYINF